MLKLIKSDAYLKPYASAIQGRYDYALRREKDLTNGAELCEWANGHLFYGLHKTENGWIFREWAPNATAIYLIGDANNWQKNEHYRLYPIGNGIWELTLLPNDLKHEQLYKLLVEWQGGSGERIPSYATRVVQDPNTNIFSAQVWGNGYFANTESVGHVSAECRPNVEISKAEKVLKNQSEKSAASEPSKSHSKRIQKLTQNAAKNGLFIYECHIGMSSEKEIVNSYEDFRIYILPRIARLGYNCLQIMAIQEHPYYGSFGYHVSNFFAASSRFGTPEELKHLIDDAHELGMMVIMDLVHSHAVKNEQEGLGFFDGTTYQYFHEGERREHPAWDSLCFDYGKPQVLHFLLSNCKFWLDVYDFDGFRFDGVTSMMYLSHGLGEDFNSYDTYYNLNEDGDAICYLTLANKLIHQVKPNAITIAEDMSGMPGLAYPIKNGGMGFDYRLAMGIPDFWIKYIKEVKDEDWKAGHIFYEMTNRRADEKTISYAESHDQALVGDKTIIFQLADSDMYWHFEHGHSTFMVDRGIALHKMIRLATASTINGGYLNFMGNEFGHPEWIDFPRQGNNWSHKYARRQWSLVDNPNFYYSNLNAFDSDMVHLLKNANIAKLPIIKLWDNEGDQIVAFMRGKLLFVFNWNGQKSFTDYGILAPAGKYKTVLNTDAKTYAGFGSSNDDLEHFTQFDSLYQNDGKEWLKLYIPARSAIVLQVQDDNKTTKQDNKKVTNI